MKSTPGGTRVERKNSWETEPDPCFVPKCHRLAAQHALGIPMCAEHYCELHWQFRFAPQPVVYYVEWGKGDRVKIGTTVHLRQRLYRLKGDGGASLLAVEPGSYALERERHRQFAGARIRGELFRRTGELEQHIREAARLYAQFANVGYGPL